jgi:hypothetical protein
MQNSNDAPVLQTKYYLPPIPVKQNATPNANINSTGSKIPPPPPVHLISQVQKTQNETTVTVEQKKVPPIPTHLRTNVENNETNSKSNETNVSSTETHLEEFVMQSSSTGDAIRVEEKHASIRELLLKAAESLKEAFPSYEELTVGDITIGLASVAVEHKKQDLLQKLYKEPCLFQIDESDFDYKSFKKGSASTVNPEGINVNKFVMADKFLNYTNFVYYPIVEPITEELVEAVVVDDANRKHYVLMGDLSGVKDAISGETITKKKEHANVRAHLVENLVQFRCESGHLQNAFFTKLEFDQHALIISVRGTDSSMDIFTNFTANPTALKAHKYYDTDDDSQREEMIEGIVHKGKLDAAKWVISQNDAILRELFFENENTDKELSELDKKKQKIDRIYLIGHSLGGAVATLSGVLLREFMLEHKDELKNKRLPPIRVVTYAPSAFISYPLSRWCRQFVDSFVIGSDIVPRFSVGQAERLRLEINESNWQTKVEQYLKEHSNIAAVVGKFNSFLTGKGYNPLINVSLPGYEEVQTKPTSPEVVKETVSTTPEGNTRIEETTKSDVTPTETIETKNSYDIETLYPPGNIYLFIEEEEEAEKDKDFGSLLIKFMEQKFSDEVEEKSQGVTATSLFRSWWSGSKEDTKKKTVVKSGVGNSVTVITEQKRRKFVVRHVDAKHFDRIILSAGMFRDHRLNNYYDALEFMEEELGAKEKIEPQVQKVRIARLPTTNTTLVQNM